MGSNVTSTGTNGCSAVGIALSSKNSEVNSTLRDLLFIASDSSRIDSFWGYVVCGLGVAASGASSIVMDATNISIAAADKSNTSSSGTKALASSAITVQTDGTLGFVNLTAIDICATGCGSVSTAGTYALSSVGLSVYGHVANFDIRVSSLSILAISTDVSALGGSGSYAAASAGLAVYSGKSTTIAD